MIGEQATAAIKLARLSALVIIISLCGCAARTVRAPAAPAGRAASADYIDVQPGWRLTTVTPVIKSGGYTIKSLRGTSSGGTLTLTASDLLGYEIAHYSVMGRPGGRVRVQFSAAQMFRNGKPEAQTRPMVALFQNARRPCYVRLVYLVRVSRADHNMAFIAAKRRDSLDALTDRVLANPTEACQSATAASCSWIPEGIAVRPEMPSQKPGAPDTWVDAR